MSYTSTFQKFLQNGRLGPLRIGSSFADVLGLLGNPSDTGTGRVGWQIAAYENRFLQISHLKGAVGLIGLYFRYENSQPSQLPAALGCAVPFTAQTTAPEFIAWLEAHKIPWNWDERLPDTKSISIPGGASANFADGSRLDSLLVS